MTDQKGSITIQANTFSIDSDTSEQTYPDGWSLLIHLSGESRSLVRSWLEYKCLIKREGNKP